MPEASPASASPASETAATVRVTKANPRPTDIMSMAGTMSVQYWAWRGSWVSRANPPAARHELQNDEDRKGPPPPGVGPGRLETGLAAAIDMTVPFEGWERSGPLGGSPDSRLNVSTNIGVYPKIPG